MEVFGEAQAVSPILQRPYRLLEGFFVVLPDTHDLAHSAHLGAQLVFNALEFLEGPAGEFDHHIVAGGRVLLQCPVAPVGYLVQGQPPCQQGRYHRDREPCRLRCQRGGT